MNRKAVSGIMLTLLLICTLGLMFNVGVLTSTDGILTLNITSKDLDYDWPMFRHDPRNTGYSASTAPNTSSLLWSYTTSGDVGSSPAVADHRVYAGSWDGKVYCLDTSSGAHIWNYTIGVSVDLSSPAVADGKVYAKGGRFYCLNASTGAHIWNHTAHGISSPVVDDGKVFVGSDDNRVYCLNASDGAFIWSYTTGDMVESSPAVADGKVFVGSDDNRVYCLNASDGAFIWSYTTGDDVSSSPAVAYGIVFVGSEDDKIYAFGAPYVRDGAIIEDSGYCEISIVHGGRILRINITLANEGDFTDTFDVTIYWNTTNEIQTKQATLTSLTNTSMVFDWDTTGLTEYNFYNITAYAHPVQGETDLADNIFNYGIIQIVHEGDVNADGKVRVDDILAVALAFGTNCGQPGYNPHADINCDGKIRIDDVLAAALEFGWPL